MRLLLITAFLCGATFAPAQAQVADSADAGDQGRIYLSWGAGYGLPGAASSFTRACGDTSHVDTLYLSFSPGRACSTFVGMTGILWFRALDGDTLGPSWEPAAGRPLPSGMTVEFSREIASGHPFPWNSFGFGHAAYAKASGNAGRIRLIWAVALQGSPAVEPGKLYGLARLLLRRPATGTPGCDQPVCISWSEGTMAYRPGDEPSVSTGVRFVGINATGGELGCEAPAKPKPPASIKPAKTKQGSTGR